MQSSEKKAWRYNFSGPQSIPACTTARASSVSQRSSPSSHFPMASNLTLSPHSSRAPHSPSIKPPFRELHRTDPPPMKKEKRLDRPMYEQSYKFGDGSFSDTFIPGNLDRTSSRLMGESERQPLWSAPRKGLNSTADSHKSSIIKHHQLQKPHKSLSTSPPLGPAASMANTLPARATNFPLLSAPTRPKGSFHPSSRNSHIVPEPPHFGTNGSSPPTTGLSSSRGSVPSDSRRLAAFRHSSSTIFPRQCRATHYLASLPSIIPGGQLLPPLTDTTLEHRLAQLEADRQRLLVQMEDRQKIKRYGLTEWAVLARENTTGSLRSELAEAHLQRLAEGDTLTGVAF